MNLRYAALDIETCPLPLDDLPPSLVDRAARRTAAEKPREAEDAADRAQRVRATDPALLWICCIGVVSTDDPWRVPEVRCFSASHPGEEAAMLQEFWDAVTRFEALDGKCRWVTFNGKGYDVPALLARSAAHGIVPPVSGLLDLYPYGTRPHCDLMLMMASDSRKRLRLEELCALLGVPSPKMAHVGGDGVAAAIAGGREDEVEAYCKADVAATMACFARLQATEEALFRSSKRR